MKPEEHRCYPYLRQRAEAAVSDILQEAICGAGLKDREGLVRSLAYRLALVAGRALDALSEKDAEPDFSDSARFPERLRQLLFSTEQDFSDFIREILSRFIDKKEELSHELFDGKPVTELTEICCDAGDSHLHGRTTVILMTNAGTCVYKPHDVSSDAVMRQLCEKYFADVTRIPKVVKGEGFGFCEYIKNRPVQNHEEAAAYYRKLGGLCAIFRMLQSSDFHTENLLCHGTFPVPVDLETVVTPQCKKLGRGGIDLFPDLSRSLYDSCLFPRENFGMQMSPLFSQGENNVAVPVVDGKKVLVKDHPEEFLDGYAEIVRRIICNKGQLLTDIKAFSPVIARVVLRKTAGYVELLMKIRSLAWTVRKDLPQEIRKALNEWVLKTGDERLFAFSDAETAALLRFDVPYFNTFGNSHDLYSGADRILTGFFSKSCVENAEDSLRSMTEESLQFELQLFRIAIRRMESSVLETSETTTPPLSQEMKVSSVIEVPSREECLRRAEQIFRQIYSDAVFTPSGDVLLFSLDERSTTPFEFMNFGFAGGYTGILLLCVALYTCSHEESIRKDSLLLAGKLLGFLKKQLKTLKTEETISELNCPCGFYQGLGGVLFALEKIREILSIGTDTDVKTMQHSVEGLIPVVFSLMKRVDSSHVTADPANGFAWMIPVLCSLPSEPYDPQRKELVQKLADQLLIRRQPSGENKGLWIFHNETRPLSGMAHGQCGYAAALEEAYRLLGDPAYDKAAQRAYDWEDRIYDAVHPGWPDFRQESAEGSFHHGYCSGAPGIGLHMLGSDTALGKRNLNRALEVTLNHPLLQRDHLCCGNSAAADFLIEAGRTLKAPAYTKKAGQILAQIAMRYDKAGCYTLCKEDSTKNAAAISLYFGSAGVAYTFLRFAFPDRLPSPLYH